MILVKNRLVIGIIEKIIKAVFKIIYKVIDFFSLQFPLLVFVIGLILFFTGIMTEGSVLYAIVFAVFVVSVFFGLFMAVKRLFRVREKKGGRGEVQIVKVHDEDEDKEDNNGADKYSEEKYAENGYNAHETYPKYYKVNQNSDYIMAEYEDKYELYYKSREGLRRVRVDYKDGRKANG